MYSVSIVDVKWELEAGQEAASKKPHEVSRAERFGIARATIAQTLDEKTKIIVPLLRNSGGGIEFDGPATIVDNDGKIVWTVPLSEIVLIG